MRMKFVFYSINVSPHQVPLAKAVMNLVGEDEFCYVAEEDNWRGNKIDAGPIRTCLRKDAAEVLENCDVLYTGGLRPIDLIERRARRGQKTLYVSERWFKPLWGRPGHIRMLSPLYRRMVRRFVNVVNENACVKFLAIGPSAALDFEKMGVCKEKIVPWGYFVEKGAGNWELGTTLRQGYGWRAGNGERRKDGVLRVLWVGRLLKLKRVDTIIQAVGALSQQMKICLDIYGSGPEEARLRKLASRYGEAVAFHPPVPMPEVRRLMREHDVFVMASNATEGWGAVVSEALVEGMRVIGTFEAGASAAMLPKERLFRCGDERALAELLVKECEGSLPPCSIGDWTVEAAARRIVELGVGK